VVWRLVFVVIFSPKQLLLMATIQKFEDLEIWQLARLLSQKNLPTYISGTYLKNF
jgi:hypothetical protein